MKVKFLILLIILIIKLNGKIIPDITNPLLLNKPNKNSNFAGYKIIIHSSILCFL